MTGDDLVRLRPSQPTQEPAANEPGDDFDMYLLEVRNSLADQLRVVEKILMKRGKINRLLCAPGQRR